MAQQDALRNRKGGVNEQQAALDKQSESNYRNAISEKERDLSRARRLGYFKSIGKGHTFLQGIGSGLAGSAEEEEKVDDTYKKLDEKYRDAGVLRAQANIAASRGDINAAMQLMQQAQQIMLDVQKTRATIAGNEDTNRTRLIGDVINANTSRENNAASLAYRNDANMANDMRARLQVARANATAAGDLPAAEKLLKQLNALNEGDQRFEAIDSRNKIAEDKRFLDAINKGGIMMITTVQNIQKEKDPNKKIQLANTVATQLATQTGTSRERAMQYIMGNSGLESFN
jgi:hypothetical protein